MTEDNLIDAYHDRQMAKLKEILQQQTRLEGKLDRVLRILGPIDQENAVDQYIKEGGDFTEARR